MHSSRAYVLCKHPPATFSSSYTSIQHRAVGQICYLSAAWQGFHICATSRVATYTSLRKRLKEKTHLRMLIYRCRFIKDVYNLNPWVSKVMPLSYMQHQRLKGRFLSTSMSFYPSILQQVPLYTNVIYCIFDCGSTYNQSGEG